jgi:hypothetical protein
LRHGPPRAEDWRTPPGPPAGRHWFPCGHPPNRLVADPSARSKRPSRAAASVIISRRRALRRTGSVKSAACATRLSRNVTLSSQAVDSKAAKAGRHASRVPAVSVASSSSGQIRVSQSLILTWPRCCVSRACGPLARSAPPSRRSRKLLPAMAARREVTAGVSGSSARSSRTAWSRAVMAGADPPRRRSHSAQAIAPSGSRGRRARYPARIASPRLTSPRVVAASARRRALMAVPPKACVCKPCRRCCATTNFPSTLPLDPRVITSAMASCSALATAACIAGLSQALPGIVGARSSKITSIIAA